MAIDLESLPDPYPIEPIGGPLDADVRVPGSKSITNRALVCAALARGTSVLTGALFADDTEAMLGVLVALGLTVETDPAGERVTVTGTDGHVPSTKEPIDVRQSGTTARFVLPLLALGEGAYEVTAHPQMQGRPVGFAIAAAEALGARIDARGEHTLPATVTAGPEVGRVSRFEMPGNISSQFLSGLLLVAPCLPDGLTIAVTTELVSRPYVDLTIAVMEAFGARVARPDRDTFVVEPTGYAATTYAVEPDASAASYPLAAAAICGGRVRVAGLGPGAAQGDAAFADVLAAMGATVTRDDRGTEVSAEPGALVGGTFDFTHISDTAQTLAMVAPFAAGTTTIEGIGFIRRKETDRILAVATELTRCGINVRTDDDGWAIEPGRPVAAVIQTYGDHRMAMSFALLGLAVPGIAIADPTCVAKTFPGYWDLLESLRPR